MHDFSKIQQFFIASGDGETPYGPYVVLEGEKKVELGDPISKMPERYGDIDPGVYVTMIIPVASEAGALLLLGDYLDKTMDSNFFRRAFNSLIAECWRAFSPEGKSE